MPLKLLLTLLITAPQIASAITIEIDYRFDGGFFNTPERRAAIRAVCDYYESILGDSLAEINPSDFPGSSWDAQINRPDTGNNASLGNITIPQDTILLFVGGRTLAAAGNGGGSSFCAGGTNAWFSRIGTRGQAGAAATPPTDYSPWGMQVTFDSSRDWNFSLTSPEPGTDFIPIALHEVGHALGIGTAKSWTALNIDDAFTGAQSRAAFGRNVPLQSGGGHWRDDQACEFPQGHRPGNPRNILSPTIAQFGTPGGRDQQALMDPSSCSTGPFLRVLTELDIAGLADLGWEIISASESPQPISLKLSSNGAAINFLTFIDHSHQLQRSTNLAGWADIGSSIPGNGQRLTLMDPSPSEPKQYYRILNQSSPASSSPAPQPSGEIKTIHSPPPENCTGCFHSDVSTS